MEQQHTKAFLNGTGGPPEMQEQDRKGGLLRDMQNFITSRNQVIFPSSWGKTFFSSINQNRANECNALNIECCRDVCVVPCFGF